MILKYAHLRRLIKYALVEYKIWSILGWWATKIIFLLGLEGQLIQLINGSMKDNFKMAKFMAIWEHSIKMADTINSNIKIVKNQKSFEDAIYIENPLKYVKFVA